MFINQNQFVKMVKSAYKSELTVANFDGGLYVGAGHWCCWMKNEHVPNKIKAVVVELSGVLPNNNQMFVVSKEKPENQYSFDIDNARNLIHRTSIANSSLRVTPLKMDRYSNEYRLLQGVHGVIHEVNEEYFLMIDKTNIDYNIESEPTGPAYYQRDQDNEVLDEEAEVFSLGLRIAANLGICWSNEICKILIFPLAFKEETLIHQMLSKVSFE